MLRVSWRGGGASFSRVYVRARARAVALARCKRKRRYSHQRWALFVFFRLCAFVIVAFGEAAS